MEWVDGNLYDSITVANYAMNLHFNPLDTQEIEESDLRERISKHDKYLLTKVPVDKLDINLYSLDDSVVEEYSLLDEHKCPPVVLSNESDGRYRVEDGNHRVSASIVRGDYYIVALVPYVEVKTLYHISLDMNIITEFHPRIPTKVMNQEDIVTPRFCVASTIEGCLSSVPWGGSRLQETMRVDDYTGDQFLFIRVYEFAVSQFKPYDIVTPIELYQNDKVPDAIYKNEYWILSKAIPSNSYIIRLTDFNEDTEDILSYHDDMLIRSGEWDYEDVWSGDVTTVITDASYIRI